MKRSKFTSFLFTIALGLFAFNFASAQTSADCQDEVNISLGGECHTAIPYQAFTSWKPSCFTITDASGKQVAAITGTGSGAFTGPNSKFKCFIEVDSIWFDTIIQKKVNVHSIPAWSNCDNSALNPDTLYVKQSELDAIPKVSDKNMCNRDTFYSDKPWLVLPSTTPIKVKIIPLKPHDKVPGCGHLDSTLTTDGKLSFLDTVTTYILKAHVKKVMRVDTFSHTHPLRWVEGTCIVRMNGVDSVVHNVTKPKDGAKTSDDCEVPKLSKLIGDKWLPGPARLKPGRYTYNAYTQDSLNFCWGHINLEYKLWPQLDGRSDTLNCVDFADYDRHPDYDYHPTTKQKLEDVCKWAEAIYTGGNGRKVTNTTTGEPGIAAIRNSARIAWEINRKIKHCYTHTVTQKDEYHRNFDWLCDTVVKFRHFYVDHPSHGSKEVKKLTTDTLYIEPIPLDSVSWPDSFVVMTCGLVTDPLLAPQHVADYLYHAVVKGKTSVITGGPTTGTGSDWTRGKPCDLFAAQYKDGKSGADNCKKMFQNAAYNNWGVAKAFPYVKRWNKLQDPALKAKFGKEAGIMKEHVNIPVYKVVCNIAASKIDLHPIEICPGEYKIFRTWTLVDWCTGTSKEKTQILKTVDDVAPAVSKLDHLTAWNGKTGTSKAYSLDTDDDNTKDQETHYFGRNDQNNRNANDDKTDSNSKNNGNFEQTVTFAAGEKITMPVRWEKVTNPWGCTVKYTFPKPTVTEHCSGWEHKYELLDTTWTSNGKTYTSGMTENMSWKHGVGMKHPIVKLTVWDKCGNDDVYYWYLKAIDKLPPIVVLHDELVVTLTANNEDFVGSVEHGPQGTAGEGIAKVYCKDIDAGSHDGDCGDLLGCAIRRKGSDDEWKEFIHLTCEDEGQVQVEYRATDWSGNTSIGWMTLTVENKRDPIIVCEHVEIKCTDPIHPDWVGYPHVIGICTAPEIEYEDDYHVDDLCFKGYIDRTWTIKGTNVSCTQRITISDSDAGQNASEFDPESIHWPLHNNGKTLEEAKWNTKWIEAYEKDAHGSCKQVGFDGFADATPSATSPTDAEKSAALKSLKFNDKFECAIGDLKEPTWKDPHCGLVGKTFEDLHVKFNDGVCFKILRTWTVIDWCVYNPKVGNKYPEEYYYVVNGACEGKNYIRSEVPYEIVDKVVYKDHRDGYYTYVQEILVVDETQPVITVIKKDTVEVGAGNKPYEGGPDGACVGTWTGTASAVDFCGDIDVSTIAEDGTKTEGPELDWYVKLVKVDKETGKETTIHGFKAIEDAQGGNEVGHEEVYSHENQSPTATYKFDGKFHEVYHVKWRVVDGCNNASEAITKVYFEDKKAPVILCYADLSTNAMSTNGEALIWAADYAHAWDCDNKEVPVYFKDADGNAVPSMTFTCDDLDGVAATKEFRVYAKDQKDNESFCEVTLRIVDSNGACGSVDGAAAIAGKVYTTDGDMAQDVEVSMGDHAKMTGVDGQFAFANNPMGLNYTLDAAKVDDHLNGVSTLDLVLIQKHILGLDQLDSPFKVIAADINNDAGVSAIDLVDLRKVILGITNEFTNNTSWRFGDAGQTFEDDLNPFGTFVEAVNVDFLTEDVSRDFIAIKVGDVSGNAIANSTMVDSRSNTSVTFEANDELVNAGEIVSVALNSSDFVGMNAFQFTLNTAGVEFVGVRSGALEMSTENLAVFDDAVTAAWTNVNAVTSGDELFTLEFRALTDTRLSSAISMTSSRTAARAYNSDLERFNTTLVFNSEEGSTVGSAFELMQNSPNPFQNVTTVGFNLGEAGPATLTVFDVTGKTVRVEAGNFDRGYNEITLTKSDLGTSGVLYYQLESGDFTATRKMILID